MRRHGGRAEPGSGARPEGNVVAVGPVPGLEQPASQPTFDNEQQSGHPSDHRGRSRLRRVDRLGLASLPAPGIRRPRIGWGLR